VRGFREPTPELDPSESTMLVRIVSFILASDPSPEYAEIP
jgi:hypothetical protein